MSLHIPSQSNNVLLIKFIPIQAIDSNYPNSLLGIKISGTSLIESKESDSVKLFVADSESESNDFEPTPHVEPTPLS